METPATFLLIVKGQFIGPFHTHSSAYWWASDNNIKTRERCILDTDLLSAHLTQSIFDAILFNPKGN